MFAWLIRTFIRELKKMWNWYLKSASEMDKLETYLRRKNITYARIQVKPLADESGIIRLDRDQIIVYKDGTRIWDVVCHSGSYGYQEGLLELMGDITKKYEEVEG